MPIEIRDADPTDEAELRAIANLTSHAFMFPALTDETWTRAFPRFAALRSIAAWDDGRCVGHVGAYTMDSVVPGGDRVKTLGVTSVAIAQTHLGGGLFRTMLNRLHDAAQRDGYVLAQLRASEAPIYGRFGYGMAAECRSVAIDCRRIGALATDDDGSIDFFDGPPIDAIETLDDIHQRSLRTPGAVTRPLAHWGRWFSSELTNKHVAIIIHSDADGVADGYAVLTSSWGDPTVSGAEGQTHVVDLAAATDQAELALYGFIIAQPLVTTVTVKHFREDSPLVHAAHDRRAVATTSVWDDQWIKVLDIDAAFAARYWPDAAPVVLEVVADATTADRFAPEALTGTWRIGAGTATRTDANPEIRTTLAGLGAAYNGAISWNALRATTAVGCTSEAARRADTLFASHPRPYAGTFF